MHTRPPSARALRTQRAQALVAASRALLLCQATAAGAKDLARARVLAREAGAPHTMVVGSSTFGAVIGNGWMVPPSSGTLFVVAVHDLERAPALWRALEGLSRVVPQALAMPDRCWTHADLLQWGGCTAAVWPGLFHPLVHTSSGLVRMGTHPSRCLVERASRPSTALLSLLWAHSSAG